MGGTEGLGLLGVTGLECLGSVAGGVRSAGVVSVVAGGAEVVGEDGKTSSLAEFSKESSKT